MTPKEAIVALRPWMDRQARVAYVPETCDHDTAPDASKFSGHPLLKVGESWPSCQCCRQPLELFLQLNLSSLPDELSSEFGHGVLQLFYCASYEPCEAGWEPFADRCSLCRVLSGDDCKPAEETRNGFPTKGIRDWTPIADYPNAVEHDRLGLELDYHVNEVPPRPAELICLELGLRVEGIPLIDDVLQSIICAEGDKLGGWPHWIQGVEYPSCPRCGSEMAFIMQLDSEENVPYMFGDAGMGYITQCREHKEVVAFGWACC